nr:Na+/H+ antiporter subunit E [Mycobacterium eburneum]
MSAAARALVETLLWWVVTTAVWLATLTAISPPEALLAAACTLPCAVLARAARRDNGGQWRFRAGWIGWAGRVLAELPEQAAQVWRYALIRDRRRRSTISPVPLPAEAEPVAAARRAAALLALATTPGTVVWDANPRTQRVMVHRIGPHPAGLEAGVRR